MESKEVEFKDIVAGDKVRVRLLLCRDDNYYFTELVGTVRDKTESIMRIYKATDIKSELPQEKFASYRYGAECGLGVIIYRREVLYAIKEESE